MSDPQSDLEALAAEIGSLLKQRGETLTTAESCTGGWISMTLTAIAGSSAWFGRGFVTYSNEAKQELLGVPAEVLASHGAVSTATASVMASGAQRAAGSDWAVSVTGIAGPDGGSADKPVGTVCFGWAGPNGLLQVQRQHFSGDRRAVRLQSVRHCLRELRGLLQGHAPTA